MADDRIEVEIVFDDSSVEKALQSIKDNADKTGKSINAAFSSKINSNIGSINTSINEASGSFFSFNQLLQASTTAFAGLSFFIGNFASEIGKVLAGAAGQFVGFGRGVFGLATKLSAIGAAFDILSAQVKKTDTALGDFLSTAFKVAGFIVGGFSFAITLGVVAVGKLANKVGTSLVDSFIKASDTFVKAERQLVVFGAVINNFNRITNNSIGSTEEWANKINELSSSLNISVISLQKASSEIIQVGTRLGLSGNQLLKLTDIVAEYAKISGKDVFDASVAFVSALNGQSQSVTSFGVKLNEAANQSFLLKKGIDANFTSLTENEKVQVRFNNLLGQYNQIQGIALAASGTLAEQNEKLKVNQERLNAALGKGAAIIENNNLVSFAYNIILNNINNSVAAALGFLGSLGARFLQIGGLALTFSFQILAVVKGLKLLNLFLASNLAQTAFARSLPILGLSLTGALTALAGTTVAIKSFSDILKAIALISLNQLKALPGLLLNIGRAAIVAIIPFIPLIAKIGIIIGLGAALVQAFKEIEKRTNIFSKALTFLSEKLDIGGKISFLTGVFEKLKNVFTEIASKAIGGLIVAFSGLFQLFNIVFQKIPLVSRILGKDFVEGIDSAANKLQKLSNEIIDNNFSLTEFGNTAQASSKKAIDNLNLVADSTGPFFDNLKNTFVGFYTIIKDSFSFVIENISELVKFSKEETAALAKGFAQTFAQSITTAIGQVINGIKAGQNAFEALGKSILNIIGDLAIFIGQFIVATGVAKLALESLPGGATIAAGLGLIALGTLLKSIGGSSFVGGGTVVGGAGGGDLIPTPEQAIEQEPEVAEKDTTKVVVNVQGDVFDSRDTGLRIVDILNQSFDTEGTRLITT